MLNSVKQLLRHKLAQQLNLSWCKLVSHAMSRLPLELRPPSLVGMKNLDRDAFKKEAELLGVKINARDMNAALKVFKPILMKSLRNFNPVRPMDNSEEDKIILFNPEKVHSLADFNDKQRGFMKERNIEELSSIKVNLAYENWNAEDIQKSILPADVCSVSGFSLTGHILHVNLRDEQQEYKHIIGQILLDKTQRIRTVVNKTREIDNEFRFFKMEVLAGEEGDFVTTVREHGCRFSFDFSKVYWNSRLSTEHHRLVAGLKRGDRVYDVFAGVGPFAIPAARKGCLVLANDLNPESYRWLVHNTRLNKVADRVAAHNLDGRHFLRDVYRPHVLSQLEQEVPDPQASHHVVMNLPALAVEFLPSFRGLFAGQSSEVKGRVPLPTVHCYSFSKDAPDHAVEVRGQVERALQVELPDHCSVHNVRNVAPNKEMMCVSFTMPRSVLTTDPAETQPPEKKPRV